jgi:hypothetical protein
MKRRATKKMLRRAEQAFSEERYADAEQIYGQLLADFDLAGQSIYDYAACVFGLLRTLYTTNRDDEAISLAQSASQTLCAGQLVEVAA